MKPAFTKQDIEFVNPVVLSTANRDYSLPYTVGLLQWLEDNGALIEDKTWKTKSHENLIENGVEVTFETIKFLFTCSYDNLVIKRISGDKAKFWGLIELFKDTEY